MAAKVSYQVHSSVLPRDNTKVSKRTSQLSGPMSFHSLSTISRANNFKNKNLNPFTSLNLVISIKLVSHAAHLEQNNQYLKLYTSSYLHNPSQLTHMRSHMFVIPSSSISSTIHSASQPTFISNVCNSVLSDIGNRLTSYMTPPRMTRQVSADSTRLVCLYDYAATAPDDLSITRGEWLYADLQDQVDDSWLWAYSPGTKRYGYVPRAYAKPPNTNGLIANPLDPYLSP